MIRPLLLFLSLAGVLPTAATAAEGPWTDTLWHGERSFVSVSHGWRAVVSLERGRLVHFGPADSDVNLLLAPPTRDNPNLLGGHRLWLAPATWARGWPPPPAWEASRPESQTMTGGVLRLTMADAGDDWPRLVRTYHWAGARLVCGAEMHGGTRPAQFIQIFQVPPQTIVSARAFPAENFPAGYVLLPSTAGPFSARFATPPHAAVTGDTLALRHTGAVVKLGFRPQILTGRAGGFTLSVSRGPPSGLVAAEPDQGFFTQVYLSHAAEGFIELEQLSPVFSPGDGTSFSVILEATRP